MALDPTARKHRSRVSTIVRRSCAAISFAAITSCTVGPDYSPPETSLPATWSELPGNPSALASADDASRTTSDSITLANWWTTFDDPILNGLIDRAIDVNPDLRAAQARVREARARRGVVAADRYPDVDAIGSYARQRDSENSGGGLAGDQAGDYDLYQVGFDAVWELDLFGGVRRSVEAADAEVAATVEDRRDVLVSLLAEVARNYVELRESQRQIEIAEANLAAQRDTLDITRSRFDAGLTSDLDVARAEAQVESTESRVPALESAARQSIHRLSVLLALEPAALLDELRDAAPIPSAPHVIPVGLPSEILRRRPDIRRAERELAASTARIGAATADLFPRFSLTGSLGLESDHFSDLDNVGSRYWNIGPSMRWPILDFGRIRNNIEVQKAREEQAFIAYEQTVLNVLREVEDALVAFSTEQARRRSLVSAVESNRRAVRLATQLHQQGLTDFLSVLQAQRDLFASEAALVESDGAVTTNLVSLYKALGGGWEIERMASAGGQSQHNAAGSRVLRISTHDDHAPPSLE